MQLNNFLLIYILLRDSYGRLQAKNHEFELHLGTPPLGVIVHAKMTEENT